MKPGGAVFAIKGTGVRVFVTRTAYTQVRNLAAGYWLVTAEDTESYLMCGPESFTDYLTQGMVVPRDESFLLLLEHDTLTYYIPAGGTLRMVPVQPV